jgi:pentafunctional AROM polypeptide
MQSIAVDGYDVLIGRGLVDRVGEIAKRLAPRASRLVVLTDSNLEALHLPRLLKGLAAAGFEGERAPTFVLEPGERAKSRGIKAVVEDWMLELRCDRQSVVVAFGGGVIGDLGGFVAATYMRGVACVQVPTTLLAMVDSSIGGKTGIDVPAGKNLIGAFHKPLAVVADPELLATLPPRELSNGMAEVIKAAAIRSEAFFARLERSGAAILRGDADALNEVVVESARIKAQVVAADEREGGQRAILNFGHTVGHAIEALMQPAMLHGECVAVGMVVEAQAARWLGALPPASSAVRRLAALCHEYRLPVTVPAHLPVHELLARMEVDKKNKDAAVHAVMLRGVGAVVERPYTTPVPRELLRKLLHPHAAVAVPQPEARPAWSAEIAVPGSKSVSNRVLVLAALGRGECRVRGLLQSEDTQVMLDALRRLGASLEWEAGEETLLVRGSGGRVALPADLSAPPLFLGNAGTAARFLTAVCALVPTGSVRLAGSARMHERPIGDLVEALRAAGVAIDYEGAQGSLPLRITAAGGGLRGGEITLAADVSSQFVSGVLLAAPYAQRPVTLRLAKGKVVSEPYIEMTVQLMRQFGVEVLRAREGEQIVYRVPQRAYDNPPHFQVEGDASSASYPLALAAVANGRVTVTNVGSVSSQGDAGFCSLLARMGCRVHVEPQRTTVEAPPRDSPLTAIEGQVDMAAMTDTFMTLCVVAAVARGTTRIVNIENQRVKECDRLHAMVTELRKCGVEARELPTGIEVVGAPAQPRGALVHCYGDHRIAMSFAVLSAAVRGVVVDDKACVEKTYPEFWEHVETRLGLRLRDDLDEAVVGGGDARFAALSGQLWWDARPTAEDCAWRATHSRSLVLVGMRGVGKTFLGARAAAALGGGYRFCDLDAELEATELGGQRISDFVAAHSWPAFRALELKVLTRVLRERASGWVLACGGGVVETPEALALLQRTSAAVVCVTRDLERVLADLAANPARPQLPGDLRDVYARRAPLYAACSCAEFVVHERGAGGWDEAAREFARFARGVLRLDHDRREVPRRDTSFVSLTCADVRDALPVLDEVARGTDALELRVDLLASWERAAVAEQLSLLRRASPLPVIFTVRSCAQGGRFPDGDPARLATLLECGARWGADLVDIEASLPPQQRRTVADAAHRAGALVVGSLHVLRFAEVAGAGALDLCFERALLGGRADIAKVAVAVGDEREAARVVAAAATWRESLQDSGAAAPACGGQAVIALAMGDRGRVARVLNRCLTPITHPRLPAPAAPGQMTMAELRAAQRALGLLAPQRFWLFGAPIQRSGSPPMHNAGFSERMLPHNFALRETTDVADVAALVRAADFGGASVTTPLKERVAPLLDALSPAAAVIGAVNAIVRLDSGALLGDNTDWIGIAEPLLARLGPSAAAGAALVVGAGGTARAALFALQAVGFGRGGLRGSLCVFNERTPDKARALAAEFACEFLPVLDPARNFAAVVVALPSTAPFELPLPLLARKPVVVDVAYLPPAARWGQQAAEAGCPLVRGGDMLLSQGIAAFRRWIGHCPPTTQLAMASALKAHLDTFAQ